MACSCICRCFLSRQMHTKECLSRLLLPTLTINCWPILALSVRISVSWYHWYKRFCISLVRSSTPTNRKVKRPLRRYSTTTYAPQSTSESFGNLFTLKPQRYLKTTMRKISVIKRWDMRLIYRNFNFSLGNLACIYIWNKITVYVSIFVKECCTYKDIW